VEKGAEVNITNVWSTNPLIYALKFGNFKIIEYLIRHGAIVDDNYRIRSPLEILQKFKTNDKEFLNYLVDRYSSINKTPTNNTTENRVWLNPSIILAIKSGDMDIVKYALNQNSPINFNIQDENNKTLFTYAVESKNEKIINLLLDNYSIYIDNSYLVDGYDNTLILEQMDQCTAVRINRNKYLLEDALENGLSLLKRACLLIMLFIIPVLFRHLR